MMRQLYLILFMMIILVSTSYAQVGINTDGSLPDPSAMLDVKSPVKGLLPPRVALNSINIADPILSPAIGLFVYNTATSGTSPNNVKPGYYFWNGTQWISVLVPQGTNTGEILYWSGAQWIAIPVGSNGQVLTLVNGIPTWEQTSLHLPTVITTPVSEITDHSAVSGGNSSDGGAPVTSRGVCWSANENPTIADNKTDDGIGSGAFSSNISGLSVNTAYHIRAYAVNSAGIGYGNILPFTTCPVSDTLKLFISSSGNSVSPGTSVLFTANPVNAGFSPLYQWKVNGLNVGINSRFYLYIPENNDVVTCVLTSNENCTIGSPAMSNTITMIVNSSLTVTALVSGILCAYENTGLIDVTVSGGTPPYLYYWSDGASSQDISSLYAGTYAITVTDDNLDTITGSWLVTEPGEVSWWGSSINCTCYGAFNGIIQTTETSGGTPPYTYEWAGPNGFAATTPDIVGLAAGNYTVTISDAHLCTARSMRLIQQPDSLAIFSTADITVPACSDSCNGSIQNIVTTGGILPYTYQWSNGTTTNGNTGLCAGSYTITVTDDNGCRAARSFLINAPPAIGVYGTAGNVSCAGQCDGMVNITVTGGVPGYVFLWSNGATTEDLQGLCANTYSVTVTDQNNCQKSGSWTVGVGEPLPLTISVTPSANPVTAGTSVTFTAITVNGGPMASYQWKKNGVNVGNISNTFTYVPSNNDTVTCSVSSGLVCVSPNPAISNSIVMVVYSPAMPCPGTPAVTYGGQTYNTVQTGTQCWLKENLNIGTMVSGYQDQANNGTIEKYCYNNNDANCAIYGGLYQWNEMMNYTGSGSANPSGRQGICPTGWHIPSDAEWCQLEVYLDATLSCGASGWRGTDAGGKMKESGNIHWISPNSGATNSSGFSALPGGYRGSDGNFSLLSADGYFWSATEGSTTDAWDRDFWYNGTQVARANIPKILGIPARCVKDSCSAYSSAGVSISPSANPVCSGTNVTLNATPINGGAAPLYLWQLNGQATGPNSPTYSYPPSNGDQVVCVMTSSEPCIFYPAVSNSVIITLDSVPETPLPGAQGSTSSQIGWNWINAGGADGFKWSATNDYNTALEMGNNTFTLESDLACNTMYTRYVWAYNSCGNSLPLTLAQSTSFIPPAMPAEKPHWVTLLQITWNWYNVPEATGYKWNSINDYASAIDMNLMTSTTETGLLCNTLYTRYVWAYDACGNSSATVLTQSTSPVPPPPPGPGYHEPYPNQITWNWNPAPDAVFYRWSTTDDFSTGTDTGISYIETGLSCDSTYTRYIWSCDPCNHSTVTVLTQTTQPCSPPVLNTTDVSNITLTSAVSGGNIVQNGGSPVSARGVCWSISPDPTIIQNHTNDGTGNGMFVSNLTGLMLNTLYYIRAYASNDLGISYGNEASFTTANICGSLLTVNHLAGNIAPVAKTVQYGTVTNIPGEISKCWITSNLGATHQATAVSDATEASAGWYWQFNRQQGYSYDGVTRTPNTTWITSINENSDWVVTNDPCVLEISSGWRLPTSTEWTNIDAAGGWNSWAGPWNSGLKLHEAGLIRYPDSLLEWRGSHGYYWSSKQNNATWGKDFWLSSGSSALETSNKAFGFSIRCIRDF